MFPDRWLALGRNTFHVISDCEANFEECKEMFSHILQLGQWRDDTDFTSVADMPRVPDLGPAKRAHRHMLKHGLGERARALTSVVLKRVWAQARQQETYGVCDGLCPRCGKHRETETHRFWQCAAKAYLGRAVTDTDTWANRAIGGNPQKWIQGVVPSSDRPRMRPEVEPQTWVSPKWQTVTSSPNVVSGSGGSGGTAGEIPVLRGVGAGAATRVKHADGRVEYAHLFATIPGRQTVPRAGLWALIQLIKHIQWPRPQQTNYIDAAYVTQGATRISDRQRGRNDDMWRQYMQVTEQHGTLDIRKTKSHVNKEQIIARGMNEEEVCVNNGADECAGVAAEKATTDETEGALSIKYKVES